MLPSAQNLNCSKVSVQLVEGAITCSLQVVATTSKSSVHVEIGLITCSLQVVETTSKSSEPVDDDKVKELLDSLD